MNATAAVFGCFLLPIFWSLVSVMVSFLQSLGPWLDLSRTETALLAGTLRGSDWLQVATAIGVWLVLPLLIGVGRLTRCEVK